MKSVSVVSGLALFASLGAASPMAKRAPNINLYLWANQVQKCAATGTTGGTCTQEPCFVPRVVNVDTGEVLAGAASTDDSDTNCATMDTVPDAAVYAALKYSEISCDEPVDLGSGISFCTDGDDGMVAHLPGLTADGATAWCNINIDSGDDSVGEASCYLGF